MPDATHNTRRISSRDTGHCASWRHARCATSRGRFGLYLMGKNRAKGLRILGPLLLAYNDCRGMRTARKCTSAISACAHFFAFPCTVLRVLDTNGSRDQNSNRSLFRRPSIISNRGFARLQGRLAVGTNRQKVGNVDAEIYFDHKRERLMMVAAILPAPLQSVVKRIYQQDIVRLGHKSVAEDVPLSSIRTRH